MKNLQGIKLALCQMKVAPGRPDLNVSYIAREIEDAAKRGADIIVFPEMAATGYFIGDLYEDEAFLRDVEHLNKKIREATNAGIAAIVGTPLMMPRKRGEDGRARILNAAVVYQNGRYIGHATKTLQPNYRIFDDDRHFFSTRKAALERGIRADKLISPLSITLKDGRALTLGVILCEDMWHDDYALNPTKVLVQKGARIIFNISSSPWTWQKNRKRHEIVRSLGEECGVPFVYVNNTGTQNTGKNIVIFDGSSAVYDDKGRFVFEVPPYSDGTHDLIIEEAMRELPGAGQNDTKELYEAVRCAAEEFFAALPPGRRKMLIGMSGGIDSSLAAALYTDILGSENVIAINMPSKFNSARTKALAETCAKNLEIAYEVRPIQDIADAIAGASDVAQGSFAYENIQARTRMEILAARSQELNCLFSANWNKVEAAFGYGTLYGDMAGALALVGDLLKREIYQLADYMNREVFAREVIPAECFTIAPSAELREAQKDPFDYGKLEGRGYHEEMVRAFTEFRKNPEWFLELHDKGMLEEELKLERGRLKKLFPSSRDFIRDLEKHWRMFNNSYFKRIQGPPIPIVSKRAFGTDLRESVMLAHLTGRYYELRDKILSKEPPRIAVYGGSFNPPALHHRRIVIKLLEWFDEVAIVPCGIRDEKDSLKEISLAQRKEMVMLNFADLPGVVIDTDDLDSGVFTPAYALDEKYGKLYPDREVRHFVGGDLIKGGGEGKSEIQLLWRRGEEVWRTLKFVMIARSGINVQKEDFPPQSEIIEGEWFLGSSTLVREFIGQGRDEEARSLLAPQVYAYIKNTGLYRNPGQ